MKKIKKFLILKPWLSGLVIGLVLALGITVSAMSLTGSVDEFKGLFGGQDQSYLGGNVTATGGICSAGDPAVTLCNIDINYLDVTTALAVDGTFAVTNTTATSTFSTGGLTVGTDKFIIEQSSGKLGIGTSTPANFISGHLSNAVALDFGVIAANSCSDLSMAVIGAVDGNTVVLGVPNALATASTTLAFSGFVSAADTVKVRVCQVAASATSDPAAATIRADVWKH